MNGKTWTMAGFLLLLGGIASNGPGIVTAFEGAWLFAVKISATAPLGLASAFLTLSACIALQAILNRWAPVAFHNPEMREFLTQAATLVAAIALMMAQLPPASRLQAFLLGAIIGAFAPFLWTGMVALWKLAARAMGFTP